MRDNPNAIIYRRFLGLNDKTADLLNLLLKEQDLQPEVVNDLQFLLAQNTELTTERNQKQKALLQKQTARAQLVKEEAQERFDGLTREQRETYKKAFLVSVANVGFAAGVFNSLVKADIRTVGDLLSFCFGDQGGMNLYRLCEINGIGPRSITQIQDYFPRSLDLAFSDAFSPDFIALCLKYESK